MAEEPAPHQDTSPVVLDPWHVVVDTSAIYKDYNLANAHTSLLLARARRSDPRRSFRLCIPHIVIREMVNHFREDLEAANERLDKALGNLGRLTNRSRGTALSSEEVAAEVTAFGIRFRQALSESAVHVEPLPSALVGVETLLRRDLLRRKPFQGRRGSEGGEGGAHEEVSARDRRTRRDRGGMRDALVWESVLELCRREPRSIAFITENTDDFADNSKTNLHQHMIDDLDRLDIRGARIELYTSIEQFNQRRFGSSASAEESGDPE